MSWTLRVADAAIMPDVVRAKTNVTTMMIAERYAILSSRDPNSKNVATKRLTGVKRRHTMAARRKMS